MRAFFEREDLPESPGNKVWRATVLSQAAVDGGGAARG